MARLPRPAVPGPQDVDLFGRDFIFVPVHEALHWSLMVVCHAGGYTAGWVVERALACDGAARSSSPEVPLSA